MVATTLPRKRKARVYAEPSAPLKADTLFQSPYYRPSYDFPYNPDDLVPSNDYSKYDEMQHDDQVKVALSLKKDMVVNTGWRVVCEDPEAKEQIEGSLQRTGTYDGIEQSFEDVLRDLLSAYAYGFSIADPVFMPPNKTVSGKFEVRQVLVRPPHSFLFHREPDGTVSRIEQKTSKGSKDISPSRILHYVYQPNFGNPYGNSDLRAAHPPYVSKKFILRMAMRYAERFAGATIVGRYGPSWEQSEVSRLQATLESFQNHTVATVPEDAAIEFLETKKDSSDQYIRLLNHLNTWIARALLVPDLLGVSGEKTAGGSYSLGVEQFKVFLASIEKDRLSLARKITTHLVKPLARVNFGEKVEASFEFVPFTQENQTEFLRLWVEAVKGKVWKPSEEEIRHYLRKTGFPEPETIEIAEPVEVETDPGKPKAEPDAG